MCSGVLARDEGAGAARCRKSAAAECGCVVIEAGRRDWHLGYNLPLVRAVSKGGKIADRPIGCRKLAVRLFLS